MADPSVRSPQSQEPRQRRALYQPAGHKTRHLEPAKREAHLSQRQFDSNAGPTSSSKIPSCVGPHCSTASQVRAWVNSHKPLVIGLCTAAGVLLLLGLLGWMCRCWMCARRRRQQRKLAFGPAPPPPPAAPNGQLGMQQREFGSNSEGMDRSWDGWHAPPLPMQQHQQPQQHYEQRGRHQQQQREHQQHGLGMHATDEGVWPYNETVMSSGRDGLWVDGGHRQAEEFVHAPPPGPPPSRLHRQLEREQQQFQQQSLAQTHMPYDMRYA